MLKLVSVTAQDVEVLFELVTMSDNVPDRDDIMAGLMQMHHHFRSSKDNSLRMVLTDEILVQIKQIVNYPFMPADADAMGIPKEHYINMISRLPHIRTSLANPEVFDPQFANTATPNKTYLN